MKDILTSPRIENMKRKRRQKRLRLFILLFVLFIVLVGALAFFSGNHRITINKIVVTGTRIINVSDVEWSVQDIISGKYLRLFTKSNIFIYPRSKIYEKLLIDFPRIDSLSINQEGLNTLNINITERAGAYLYCGDTIPEVESEIGENCYFINNDGYIFDKAPYFSGNVYFKYYIALTGDNTNPLGHQALSPERFHEVARFIDGVVALGFKPTHIIMSPDVNTLYLHHGDIDTSPQIIFKDTNNLHDILENLSLSMSKREFASEINSKYTTLLYIDLRFDDKVLYKFQ